MTAVTPDAVPSGWGGLAGLRRRIRATSMLKVFVFGLLVVMVGLPLYRLVAGSFRTGTPFEPGAWTLGNYARVFSDPFLGEVVFNTFLFASGTTAFAMTVGIALAWLVVRTDLPWARGFEYATLALLLIPVLIGAIAWATLLLPRTGLLNSLVFDPLFGWRFNPYSLLGMIWVQSLYMVPLVFVLVAAAFRRADPEMEHAMRASGASRMRTFFKVSLGTARPAVLSAFVIVFVIGIESIEMFLIFGLPGQVYVFAGDVFRALRLVSPAQWGVAAAISVVLIGAVVLVFLAYVLATRKSHRFITVGGRGRSTVKINLGKWRWPAFAFVSFFFFVTLVLPFLAIVYTSFVDSLGPPTFQRLATASWDHYIGVFNNSLIIRATRNSLILATGASIAVVIFAILLAVLSIRHPSWLARVNDSFALLPLSVPRIAMAPAVLWAYILLPFGIGTALYGTLWILGLAYVALFIPITARQVSSQLIQIAPELEHASRVGGSGPLRTVWRIVVPLLAPALAGAFFLAFVSFFREFTASILLFTSGTEVFSVAMYDMFANGRIGQVSALAVMFVIVIVAMLNIANRLFKGGNLFGD